MKKIYIDTSFTLKTSKTGIGVYVYTLFEAIKKKNLDYKTIEFNIPNKIRFKNVWYKIWLNTFHYFWALINKPDVIIYPNFIMPFFKRKETKYITVIHDLCCFRENEMPKNTKNIFARETLNTINRADTIITVSKTIKQELIDKFNVNPDRIKVVHNAIADYFIGFEDKPELLEKYKVKDKKYILSVATLNKRKNIPELIKAFESISDKYPDIKLILVGGMGNEQKEKLTQHPNIIFTGYIEDKEIPVLYKYALMYIFPSIYEGFGTPVMEAQYSGTPLICSDIPIFRDTAGKGAEFCSMDYKGIAEKIEFLINNPQRREELIQFEAENVKRFDIDRVAEQLMEAVNN